MVVVVGQSGSILEATFFSILCIQIQASISLYRTAIKEHLRDTEDGVEDVHEDEQVTWAAMGARQCPEGCARVLRLACVSVGLEKLGCHGVQVLDAQVVAVNEHPPAFGVRARENR